MQVTKNQSTILELQDGMAASPPQHLRWLRVGLVPGGTPGEGLPGHTSHSCLASAVLTRIIFNC